MSRDIVFIIVLVFFDNDFFIAFFDRTLFLGGNWIKKGSKKLIKKEYVTVCVFI